MGDPNSPGMCIGACAWMEKEWMNGLSSETKRYFRATRYMDDVLTLVADNPHFDLQEFMNDFNKSECYWKPLRLEDASAGTFLETSFEISNGKCRHWLKNTNKPLVEPKVWRYAHYHSYTPWRAKRSVMIATLKKVQKMASDPTSLTRSAIWKLMEFRRLKYPPAALLKACSALAVTSRNPTWFRVKQALTNILESGIC